MKKFRVDVYKGIIEEELFKTFNVECESEPMARIIALGTITQMEKLLSDDINLFYALTEIEG